MEAPRGEPEDGQEPRRATCAADDIDELPIEHSDDRQVVAGRDLVADTPEVDQLLGSEIRRCSSGCEGGGHREDFEVIVDVVDSKVSHERPPPRDRGDEALLRKFDQGLSNRASRTGRRLILRIPATSSWSTLTPGRSFPETIPSLMKSSATSFKFGWFVMLGERAPTGARRAFAPVLPSFSEPLSILPP